MAARETPTPQIMVRLRNDSGRRSVRIHVNSGSNHTDKDVDLPPREIGEEYLCRSPRLGEIIQASIDPHDELPADDQAALIRQGSFPRVEQHGALSPELRRMLDVYSKSRPPEKDRKLFQW